jgi:hypothetical protein
MPASSRNVTWSELFSDAPEINCGSIFATWAPAVSLSPEIAPIGMSAFGSIFFAKRDNTIQCLNPLKGSVSQAASTIEEFRRLMNTESWQVEHLHSKVVAQVVTMGFTRKPNQVFGLAPHPNFTGGLSLERSKVIVLDAEVWHSIAFQSFYKSK